MQVIKKEINELKAAFDLQEIVKRAIKYLIEGGAVAVAAFYIPKKTMKMEEVIMIAITAAATFALLDMYAPSIAQHARMGSGLGIGSKMVGGL